MKVILHKRAGPSSRFLRDALKEYTKDPIFVSQDEAKHPNPIVRYGNRFGGKGVTKFNTALFIKLMAKKEFFSWACINLNFLSPIFSKERPGDFDFPLLIRKRLDSRGGVGIIKIETREEFNFHWNNKFFWTSFIPTTLELRIHLLCRNNGEIIIPRLFKKIFDGDTPEEPLPIRTQDNYHYSLRKNKTYPKAVKEATLFGEALYSKFKHGFFMSLDAGYSKEYKRYVFFEGNSASGLNSNSAKILAKFLYEEGVLN